MLSLPAFDPSPLFPAIIAGFFGIAGIMLGGALQARRTEAEITKQITDTALSLIKPLRDQLAAQKADYEKIIEEQADVNEALEAKIAAIRAYYEKVIDSLNSNIAALVAENKALRERKTGMMR